MLRNSYKGFSPVAVVVIIAVIAGIGAFTILRSSSTSKPSATTERTSDKASKESTPTGDLSSTIQDIVGRGQSLECDWKMPTTGSENPFGAGKLYTTGNKGRSEISGGTEGVAIEGNAIYKDDTVYSWIKAGGTTIGFKFDKAELESMAKDMTAEQKQQAEQIRQQMIFNCKPWTPDESKFDLPSGVDFK
jgi:hypothetical protein